MIIKYTGTSHYRELRPQDFKQADVEVPEPLVFGRNEATEVSDEVAEAIKQLVPGEFETVRKNTKQKVRDLTVDDPEPPKWGDRRMTDRVEPESSPAGNRGPETPTAPPAP